MWQNFDYTPWESKESQYHWAALMAEAVGKRPGQLSRRPEDCRQPRRFAQSICIGHYEAQPLLNKIAAAVGFGAVPRLATPPQRKRAAAESMERQRADGGWSLTDLGTWQRRDKTPLETRPDGYATGMMVLALEENHVANLVRAARRCRWLVANQDKTDRRLAGLVAEQESRSELERRQIHERRRHGLRSAGSRERGAKPAHAPSGRLAGISIETSVPRPGLLTTLKRAWLP